MSDKIEPRVLRAPNDLFVTQLTPRRALIVGSCLSEGYCRRMLSLEQPCESDLYQLGRDLPESPARPISEYDFQLVQLALRFVLPDQSFAKLDQTDLEGHEKLFNHALNGTRRFLEGAMRWNREHSILTFVFPFIPPVQNMVGRLMPRFDLRNPVYFIEQLNQALAKELSAYNNAYYFDLNEIFSYYGRRYVQEDSFMAINHGGFISNYDFSHDQNRLETAAKATDFYDEQVNSLFLASWHELLGMYRTIRQLDVVKLLVVDLDDTLWRGVVAELDVDSLPTSEGWPLGLWEALRVLKRRGVLLAIISKNEESRVREVWDRILKRSLSLEDFAIVRINWRTKAENMAEILAHVNLLPRNVLYIDDNPAERAAVQAAFPELRVLGGTPLTWRRILLWSPETQVPTVTAESVNKTEMVRAQVVREEKRQVLSREEFLASLNVHMTLFEIGDAAHARFPRVLELINKTNQFNTTGRRWSREDCVAAFATGTAFYAFEVSDQYTEYGLVGVLIVSGSRIAQFVMSCRIMGLEAEVAAIALISEIVRAGEAAEIVADMIETERNLPCRDVYSRCGFESVDGRWHRSLTPPLPIPVHITLTRPVAREAAVLEPAI
jgi:FkbH-like protein